MKNIEHSNSDTQRKAIIKLGIVLILFAVMDLLFNFWEINLLDAILTPIQNAYLGKAISLIAFLLEITVFVLTIRLWLTYKREQHEKENKK